MGPSGWGLVLTNASNSLLMLVWHLLLLLLLLLLWLVGFALVALVGRPSALCGVCEKLNETLELV